MRNALWSRYESSPHQGLQPCQRIIRWLIALVFLIQAISSYKILKRNLNRLFLRMHWSVFHISSRPGRGYVSKISNISNHGETNLITNSYFRYENFLLNSLTLTASSTISDLFPIYFQSDVHKWEWANIIEERRYENSSSTRGSRSFLYATRNT